MKFIVVQWQPEKSNYKKAMIVICSNHLRFSANTRFDFGFLEIASCEGYAITVLPSKDIIDERIKDGHFRDNPYITPNSLQ